MQQQRKPLSLAEKIVQGKYETVRQEQASNVGASANKKKPASRQAPTGRRDGSPQQQPRTQAVEPLRTTNMQKNSTNPGKKSRQGTDSAAITISKLRENDPIEEGPKDDQANKTAEDIVQNLGLHDDRRDAEGLSDNMHPFKSNLSDNLGVAENDVDDLSPRFHKVHDRQGEDGKGDESISLTQYYLKGSVQERKAAHNEQDEFMKTLNQMENEDVPPQVIEEYRKAEILRKSMAVVQKHAKKMDDIRTSPERYDRVKGKIKTKNPFAANLSSVAGSKRTMMNNTTRGGMGDLGRPVNTPILEESIRPNRLSSPAKHAGGAKGADGQDDWYRPELGEIPYAPLTKANRAKIEKRDQEIAAKEQELDEIMASINSRKQERAEKEAAFKAQDLALKKKRKAAKKAKAQKDGTLPYDHDEAAPMEMDEPIDEEGQMKKDAVLDALQQIKTHDFTELKTMRKPKEVVKKIIEYTGFLLLRPPCEFRQALQELISKPKAFIEMSLGLEDRLEASHLQVLRDFRKEQIELDSVMKVSSAAYGLALWLTALSDFSHHTGLQRKAKFVPTAKRRQEQKQQWQHATNANELNDEVLMRMPKWSNGQTLDPQRTHQSLQDDQDIDAGGDYFQQQLIQQPEIHPETQALIDAVEQATLNINKQVATEIKNLPNPPAQVLTVVTAVADFVEGKTGSTWQSCYRKVFEMTRKGVGARDCVSEQQLATLRAFVESGTSVEGVKQKSSAAATLVVYLNAMHALQENLLVQPGFGGLPQTINIETSGLGGVNNPNTMYATIQAERSSELNALYNTNGKSKKGARGGPGHKRKGSSGLPGKKNGVEDEMERKLAKDKAEDSDQEEMGIDGKPKHRFYNDELERKTKEIQDQFAEMYASLMGQREGIDRDAFYEAIDELNYGGISKFEVSPTRRLVKHHNHTVEQKTKFQTEHQRPTQKGNQYSVYSKSYIVEPADGKGLNYKLIDKKPLKFYDQVLEQDVIKKKVYKDRDQAFQQSMMQDAHGDPNMSKVSRRPRMSEVPLSYQETIGKRGVGVLVDECRRHIEEQNYQRSQSPFRGGDGEDISANGASYYPSVSARNINVANSQSSPFLQVPGQTGSPSNGSMMAHLQKNRETARVETEQQLRTSTAKKSTAKKTAKRFK